MAEEEEDKGEAKAARDGPAELRHVSIVARRATGFVNVLYGEAHPIS